WRADGRGWRSRDSCRPARPTRGRGGRARRPGSRLPRPCGRAHPARRGRRSCPAWSPRAPAERWSSDPFQARDELVAQRLLLDELLALLLHDLRRRALRELRAREFGAPEGDRLLRATDLFLQSLPLGREVDDALERHVELGAPHHAERRIARAG